MDKTETILNQFCLLRNKPRTTLKVLLNDFFLNRHLQITLRQSEINRDRNGLRDCCPGLKFIIVIPARSFSFSVLLLLPSLLIFSYRNDDSDHLKQKVTKSDTLGTP